MDIPIIIINKNRLSTTKFLVDQLRLLDYTNIYILDLNSTYPPLVEWYSTCSYIKIIKLEQGNHKSLWEQGVIDQFSMFEFIAVTDSDIRLDENTPKGFIETLVSCARDHDVDKAGLAIRIDNITNDYLKKIVYPIEVNYWQKRVYNPECSVYNAPVDTTFCVVRTDQPFTYNAIRIGNWPITHLDWYSDWNNLTEEERYYFDHADERIATTKAHYLQWKKEHLLS